MPAEEGKKRKESEEAVESRSLRYPQESQESEEPQHAESLWICHAELLVTLAATPTLAP